MVLAEPITVNVATSIWTLVAAVAAAFAAAVAAGGVAVQYRQNRRAHGLDFLWRSIQSRDSPDMHLRRSQVASDLLSTPPKISKLTIEVLNFFDLVGFYVRSKGIRLEAAWSAYCGFVVNYRSACRGELKEQQREDPTIFADLEFLTESCLKVDQKKREKILGRRISRSEVEPSYAEVAGFLRAEADLRFIVTLPPPPPGAIPTSPLPSLPPQAGGESPPDTPKP